LVKIEFISGLYKMSKKTQEILKPQIPKPKISKRHRKGDQLLNDEQKVQLQLAGITMHIEFVFGTPKSSPVKESPRQETPHARAKYSQQPRTQLGVHKSARKLEF
jgi:hypothetical protein